MWKIFILIFDEIQNTIVIWYLIHDNNDFDQPPLCESYTVFVFYGSIIAYAKSICGHRCDDVAQNIASVVSVFIRVLHSRILFLFVLFSN